MRVTAPEAKNQFGSICAQAKCEARFDASRSPSARVRNDSP
jgi:hypothetical protein